MDRLLICVAGIILLLECTFGVSGKGNRVILISMDGFRHDYLDLAKAKGKNISSFEAIIEDGFRARVQPVTPPITFPAHFAMATGRYVENHGLMSNKFYLPEYNATFDYKNAEDAKDPKWWSHKNNEPIWITNERHPGKRSCVIFWPGSATAYRGRTPSKTLGGYNGSVNFKDRVQKVVDWMEADETITLCAVYMNEPDSTGHQFGPNSEAVLDKVEEMNDVVAFLLEKIGSSPTLKDSINVVIASDHGMSETNHQNEVNICGILSPQDYISNEGSIFLGIWPNPRGPTADSLYKRLKDAKLQGLTVYRKEDLPRTFHYAKTSRCPPVILIADRHHVIVSHPGEYYSRGEHGYDSQYLEMHPFLVACGPDVKRLDVIQHLKQVDLYPFICGLIGLQKPNKIDGDINRVLPLLRNQPSNAFIDRFMHFARLESNSGSFTITSLMGALVTIALLITD